MKLAPVIITTLLVASDLMACQVPVFRFALERWAADNFKLLVTSSGPLEGDLQQELTSLQESLEASKSVLNLDVQVINLETLTEAEKISLPALEHITDQPTLTLLPPESWPTDEPRWSGPATSENLALLVDSPARQRCVQHLMKGESAVWLIVEGSDPDRNAHAKTMIDEGLARATELLEIPKGVIRREDLSSMIEQIDLDNVLRSDVPLKISFVTERVSRDDPAEAIFLRTLPGLPATSEDPLIVPIFGRGRTPGPRVASRLSPDLIFAACQYLCGACSCQAKIGNPGLDLLFKSDWDTQLNNTVLTADSPLVQNALDVVTFHPEEESETTEQGKGGLPLIPTIVSIVALALGGFYLFAVYKTKAGASSST